MRYGMEDGDFEARTSRLTGSLDAIAELIGGQAMDVSVKPGTLAYLIDLVASEAHALLDDEADRRPMGGPLRAVD